MIIEGDQGRHIPDTQASRRLVHLHDLQVGELIAPFVHHKVRVRGPQIISSGEIMVRGDLQYRGAASAVDYISDSVAKVQMLAMPVVRLGL